MSQIEITTSQNVNISFTLASGGERIVAFLLDMLVIAAYGILVSVVFGNILNIGLLFSHMDSWSVRAILTVIFLPVSFYALLTETFLEGQTLGKKIMKIRVIKIYGYQAGIADYAVRWIFRIFEIYMTMGIPAVISVIVSAKHQRLGDLAAGTAVISLKNSTHISDTILENLREDYVPMFPQVISLSDNDMRIIKENFVRALKVDDGVMISRLRAKIIEILKIEYDDRKITPRVFISTIIKDYNYYTGRES